MFDHLNGEPRLTGAPLLDAEEAAGQAPAERVATWIARRYGLDGQAATISDLGEAGHVVLVHSLRRSECVLAYDADLPSVRAMLKNRREEGWEVWALVPLARLGEAHVVLAGSADFVQGWWSSRPEAVSFTEAQLP